MKHLDTNKVILSNQGFMKINDIEIAELKELKITMTPEFYEQRLLNSVTKAKVLTGIDGLITFEINKVYSRFKPTVLECYKNCLPFYFSLEATVKAPKNLNHKHREEESISIDICWLEGDLDLICLKSDAELTTEKYQSGFVIESADFSEIIDDEEGDWESLCFGKHEDHPPIDED